MDYCVEKINKMMYFFITIIRGIKKMILELIFKASFFVQLIMIVLLFLSCYSIYIIIESNKKINRVCKELDVFEAVKSNNKENMIGTLYTFVGRFKRSNLGRIFSEPLEVVEKSGLIKVNDLSDNKVDRAIDVFESISNKNIELEKNKGEENIKILATISSVAPYIGLMGTVIGIMNSFMAITEMKSVGLEYLAPSIAEALIVTAMGLFVAIPSNIFFNKLMFRIEYVEEFYKDIKNNISSTLKKKHIVGE